MDKHKVVQDVACINQKCDYHGKTGQGNVVIRRIYGADEIRFLRCRDCHQEFSERHGTPLFGLRIAQEDIVSVVNHLAEGTGVRKTARLTGISRDTVGRILKRVGKHAKEVHDLMVRDVIVPEVQMDEMWAFVGKKRQKNVMRRRGQLEKLVAFGII